MLVRFGTRLPSHLCPGPPMAEKIPISIVYEEPEDRPTIPVSGAFGGIALDSSLVFAHLYAEFGTLPAMHELEADEEGRVDTTKGNLIRRGDLTRKVLATLVLTPTASVALGQWLVEKGKMAFQQQRDQQRDDDKDKKK